MKVEFLFTSFHELRFPSLGPDDVPTLVAIPRIEYLPFYIVVENNRKSLIQHCERSELRLHFEWPKIHKKCPKLDHFAEFSEKGLF